MDAPSRAAFGCLLSHTGRFGINTVEFNFRKQKPMTSRLQFVHWEKGRDVFERLLIDADWAINNGNWMWLSCSSFFYQVSAIQCEFDFPQRLLLRAYRSRNFISTIGSTRP